eukprot:jgi/Bigna1/81003/fgenesh1_pg.76_\
MADTLRLPSRFCLAVLLCLLPSASVTTYRASYGRLRLPLSRALYRRGEFFQRRAGRVASRGDANTGRDKDTSDLKEGFEELIIRLESQLPIRFSEDGGRVFSDNRLSFPDPLYKKGLEVEEREKSTTPISGRDKKMMRVAEPRGDPDFSNISPSQPRDPATIKSYKDAFIALAPLCLFAEANETKIEMEMAKALESLPFDFLLWLEEETHEVRGTPIEKAINIVGDRLMRAFEGSNLSPGNEFNFSEEALESGWTIRDAQELDRTFTAYFVPKDEVSGSIGPMSDLSKKSMLLIMNEGLDLLDRLLEQSSSSGEEMDFNKLFFETDDGKKETGPATSPLILYTVISHKLRSIGEEGGGGGGNSGMMKMKKDNRSNNTAICENNNNHADEEAEEDGEMAADTRKTLVAWQRQVKSILDDTTRAREIFIATEEMLKSSERRAASGDALPTIGNLAATTAFPLASPPPFAKESSSSSISVIGGRSHPQPLRRRFLELEGKGEGTWEESGTTPDSIAPPMSIDYTQRLKFLPETRWLEAIYTHTIRV